MIVLIVAILSAPLALAQNTQAIQPAGDAPLDIHHDVPHRNPTGHMSYYFDSTRALTIEQIDDYSDRFQTVDRSEIEFGYVDDAVWLRLAVINDGTSDIDRYILLETNWMESLQLWLSSGSRHQLILDQSQNMTFAERKVPHQNLAAQFSIQAGESAVFWIRYTSRGTTALPINIETELSFVQRSQYQSSKSAIFYALMLLFITIAFLSYFLFRNSIFPIYVGYASVVLLYVMHRDGFTFQYLWPDHPNFNAFASLPIGVALGAFAILFSRKYLATGINYPRTDKLLIIGLVVLVSLVPYGLLFDEQNAKQFATIGVFLIAVTLLILGLRSWLDRGRRMLFFVAGWFGVVSASLATVLGSVFEANISRAMTLDSIRTAMVFDAVMMGFAMAERVLEIRSERDHALQERVNTLQSNVNLHKRLNVLEARYSDALNAARKSGKILADATHDIRQPLFALRASLHSMASNPDSSTVASANRNLVYLEQLVHEYLEKATDDPARSTAEEIVASPSSLPVGVVLTAVHDMFASDAQARGLMLRIRPSTAELKANPMVVSRIVNNFVSNAIQYTERGGVLVGVRRIDGQKFIAVYDSGPGMHEAAYARNVQRSERGSSENVGGGKGLGLDIALSLAQEHGLSSFVRSVPGHGSVFAVAVSSHLRQIASS